MKPNFGNKRPQFINLIIPVCALLSLIIIPNVHADEPLLAMGKHAVFIGLFILIVAIPLQLLFSQLLRRLEVEEESNKHATDESSIAQSSNSEIKLRDRVPNQLVLLTMGMIFGLLIVVVLGTFLTFSLYDMIVN